MGTRRTLVAAALALPFASVKAQKAAIRIAWLATNERAHSEVRLNTFLTGLRQLGWEQGRDFTVEARWGARAPETLARYAADIVQSAPDLVVTQGPSVNGLARAGAKMPVLFILSGDPVAARLADSLHRPGRNFTGLSLLALDLVGKRIELLKELVPSMKTVAVIINPGHAGMEAERGASAAAAHRLGLGVLHHSVRNDTELLAALGDAHKGRAEGVELFPDNSTMLYSERIAEFARRQKIPAISGWAEFVERGNVLSYGPDIIASFGRLASHADRIMRGARPGDLPIELPTRFELCVNQRAAAEIGIRIPPAILSRADRLIT